MERLTQIASASVRPIVVGVMLLLAVAAPLGWGAAVYYYLSAQQGWAIAGQAQGQYQQLVQQIQQAQAQQRAERPQAGR
jgi:hypothetical protein